MQAAAAFGRETTEDSKTELNAVAQFWEDLRHRVMAVVQDCNCTAQEPIWSVKQEKGHPLRLHVKHAEGTPELELSMDEDGLLVCRFGLASADCWLFQMTETSMLRRAAVAYCIEDAVNQILDHLVLPQAALPSVAKAGR